MEVEYENGFIDALLGICTTLVCSALHYRLCTLARDHIHPHNDYPSSPKPSGHEPGPNKSQ